MSGQGADAGLAFDMDAAVRRLTCLAANKQALRPQPSGEGVLTAHAFTLCRVADIPEPSPEWSKADAALKAFADELAAVGGVDLMVEVYDEAAERHGYRSISGVSASWSGCHGWWH